MSLGIAMVIDLRWVEAPGAAGLAAPGSSDGDRGGGAQAAANAAIRRTSAARTAQRGAACPARI
jgi:hypothetical protein